jgi:secreted PhoX family phosphatase
MDASTCAKTATASSSSSVSAPTGALFQGAKNLLNENEFAGTWCSHDGRFMFVNIQSPGMTVVIEGPGVGNRSAKIKTRARCPRSSFSDCRDQPPAFPLPCPFALPFPDAPFADATSAPVPPAAVTTPRAPPAR